MSLHKFAEQVASQGRGDDSLLVHMTPDEVQRLQAFAQANGRSLTINPDTGLPEAGMLSDLFKMVAPIALGAFLGPGAFGIAGMGLSAGTAGLITGGITSLATGSLSRGLMAGLGAYGGAGLAQGFMDAGTTALGGAGAEAALQAPSVDAFVGNAEGMTSGDAFNNFLKSDANPAVAGKADVFGAGAKAAALDPLGFAKNNLGNLAYAAAPIAAGLMVPTTTKLGDPKDTGRVRQMAFNINPDTGRPDPLYGMREMPVVKTSDFGDKTFKGQRDLFYQQNPNPYALGVGSLNQPPQQQQQPTPMAGGGIVALASGGNVQHFAIGDVVKGELEQAYKDNDVAKINEIARANMVTAADIADTYKGFDTSGIKGLQLYTPPNFGDSAKAAVENINNERLYQETGSWEAAAKARDDAANAANAATWNQQNTDKWNAQNQATWAAQPIQYTDQQIGAYLTANPNVDINQAIKDTRADPNAVNRYIASLANPFVGSTDTTGGSGVLGIYNRMVAEGIDPSEMYKAEIANDPKYAGYTQAMIQKAYDLSKGAYALSDQLKGVVADKDWVKFMDDNKYSIDDAAQAFGLSRNEVRDRYNAVKNAEKVITKIGGTGTDGTGAVTGSTGTGTGVTAVTPTPFTSVIPGGFYGNATNPGDITTNKDGTVTVHPNIPYRPYGGFSGIEEVSDAYTKGGGSLGYTSPVVKTPAEHAAAYNKLTDDSLDAYNFLMGKGKNLTQRKAETRNRPVMQRYDEAVLGRKIAKPGANTTTTTKSVVGVPGNPQSYFDEKAYLEANPDVAAEMKAGKSNFATAYEHWLMYGKKEGRKFMGDYEGYTTAAALAAAAGAGGGGDGPTGPSGGGNPNSISGFTPAPPNDSIPDVSMSPVSVAAPPAAPPGDDGDSAGDDAVGGYYSRGKLNYRSKDMAMGGATGYAIGGGLGSLGSYSDGGRLLKGPGDGVSDSIPATIGQKQQPARLADGEFVIPARIVSELGNGSTDAGAKKLYAMMDRVQRARGKTTGKNKVAANSRADKYLPA